MAIGSITNLGSSIMAEEMANYSSAKDETLGRDQFLTLLVAQLKNQDPLNPLESQDFTAQMAQFSSLEQLFDMNESLGNIKAAIQSGKKENVLDYIGLEIKAEGNTLYKNGDSIDPISYYLEDSGEVVVNIYDENGLNIRQIQAGYQGSGDQNLTWDGKDKNGNTVKDGFYNYEISAMDSSGYEIRSTTYSKGEVTGVSNQFGETYLIVGERLLTPDNVLEVLKK